VRRVLELARKSGFEIVQSSQLPLDEMAVDGDEGVERAVLAHVPMARTELALRCLLAQPAAWKRRSFSVLRPDPTLRRLLHPPRLAIVGAPNVGKSTLANQLFAQQRSITADVPGTTRDWVGELADIGGMPAVLIDTPGVRETEDAIERAAIVASASRIVGCELVIRVLDAGDERNPHPNSRQVGISLRSTSSPPGYREREEEREIVVANKIDLAKHRMAGAIGISARTGEGIDLLCAEIHRRLGVEAIDQPRMRWWTERQREEIRFRI
jgi:small GTP-binding protein